MGASEYYLELGLAGGAVPKVQPAPALAAYKALGRAMAAGLVSAAHDCADGGLAVACAEMAFAGGLGMELDFTALAKAEGLAPDALLFSETPSRLVVAVPPARRAEFEHMMKGVPCHMLGTVSEGGRFTISGGANESGGGTDWVDASISELKAAWQETLREF